MTVVFCMIVGAIVGWLSVALLHLNEARNTITCVVIGALGGFIGGKMVAPMLFAPAPAGEVFNVSTLFSGFVVASICIAVGHWIGKRWDV